MSRTFFERLGERGTILLNTTSSILSNLSSENLSVKSREEIMKFLYGIISKKASHADQLIRRLCQSFLETDAREKWVDASFYLSSMASVRDIKIISKYAYMFKRRLSDNAVLNNFCNLVTRAKSKSSDIATSLEVEELARIVNGDKEETHEAENTGQRKKPDKRKFETVDTSDHS
ncbi:unnamed protein product [Oikopleura dioica]|uniref:Condensin complex subunit 1 C-terminal domain-containing protein n=1 Tax=Oikopleura dioica TaxID=34765 RepID=E4XJK1_OIKDI|nr:unnamed protein product [Oikopleura dioica]